ncbi:MAG: hypothetical protein ACR2KT_16555 [Methylocella sp.]
MLRLTFRNYAWSPAVGALLLGGASVAAGATTLPGSLPGAVTEQSAAEIFTDGADAAKVEQVWWRGRGYGWHRGWGWRHRGYSWRGGYGWRGGRWCYWHPYACRGY